MTQETFNHRSGIIPLSFIIQKEEEQLDCLTLNNTRKTLRTRRNSFTQRELAKKLGITQAYLSMILAGKRKNQKVLDDLRGFIRRAS